MWEEDCPTDLSVIYLRGTKQIVQGITVKDIER